MFKRAKLEIKKRVSQLIENEYDFLSAGMNLNCLFLKNKLTETEKEVLQQLLRLPWRTFQAKIWMIATCGY